MALSDIVNVSIGTANVNLQLPGFGIPLILSCTSLFTDRVRFYTDLAGMVSDGFTTSSPEYKAAAAIFAQNPRVKKVAVGRRALLPTQRWKIVPTAVNNAVYKLKVNGTTVSYTADGSATLQEIIDGLKALIDPLGLAVTTSNQGPNTSLRVVANVAGAWFYLEALDPTLLNIEMDHADPGVATDMAAIQTADNTWYGVIDPWASTAEATALAAWVESNTKLFLCTSQQTDIIQTAAPGSDLAGALKTANYFRTKVFYHPDPGSFPAAAWMGAVFPWDPSVTSTTWEDKTLAGISTTPLTATQRTNAMNKNAGVYESVSGLSLTQGSKVAAGEWLDIIVGRDWLQSDMQGRVLTLKVAASASGKKIPYTDGGIQQIGAQVQASLGAGKKSGLLDSYTVTLPLAASISSTDKQNRTLNGVLFDGVLAGAIHATNITGNVHV
jgi:hypothetical protein